MSIQVTSFDDREAEKVLKSCPKIVQVYVKLLKKSVENWKDISQKAINKLKEK